MVAAVSITGLFVVDHLIFNSGPQAVADTGTADSVQAGAVSVAVSPAADLFVYPSREALAVVLPRNESKVAAQVTAVVSTVVADVGQQVRADQVLATLDSTDIKLSLAQALATQDGLRARLQLARRQLKRLRDLKSNNFVSTEAVNQRDAEVVSLRAELKGSAAQVAIMRRQLEKCTIRAPFDAVVSARSAQVGELAAPGAVLFTLTEQGGEQVSASISPTDAVHMDIAASYSMYAGGRSVPLALQRISPVVSRQTRSREARLLFADPNNTMPAGTEGRIRWQDARPHLPPDVLVKRNGKLGAFLLRNGKAMFVPVPGAQEGRPAASPVGPQTQVIRQGQARLQEGESVQVGNAGS